MNLYSAETVADHLATVISRVDIAMQPGELRRLADWLYEQAMDEPSYSIKKFLYDSAEFVESTLGDME